MSARSGDAASGRGLSARWRLTLVYAAVSVGSATLLLTMVYLFVRSQQGPQFVVGASEAPFLGSDGGVIEMSRPDLGVTGDVLVRRALVDAEAVGVERTLDTLLWWSVVGLLLTAAVSVAVGWLFAGRVLAPVHTITSRAREITATSLDERLALGGPRDELREMADTFDELLDRVQHAFDNERRLVATMSHELRTPLANQRATLDVALGDPGATAEALRSAAQVALGQCERADRTVDALLTLARVQSGLADPVHEPLDLAALVEDLVAESRAGSSLAWTVHLDPTPVLGDGRLLERAVSNLLENADHHNVPDGWVDVSLRAGRRDVVLAVANSGRPLGVDEAEQLVLPFRRGVADRTDADRGVGLGLSIVRAVAEHHDGGLSLRPLQPGGLCVELRLPTPGDPARSSGTA